MKPLISLFKGKINKEKFAKIFIKITEELRVFKNDAPDMWAKNLHCLFENFYDKITFYSSKNFNKLSLEFQNNLLTFLEKKYFLQDFEDLNADEIFTSLVSKELYTIPELNIYGFRYLDFINIDIGSESAFLEGEMCFKPMLQGNNLWKLKYMTYRLSYNYSKNKLDLTLGVWDNLYLSEHYKKRLKYYCWIYILMIRICSKAKTIKQENKK